VRLIVLGEPLPDSAAPSLQPPAFVAPQAKDKGQGDILRELQKGTVNPDLLEQVERDLLGTASPEAKQKFNEMLQGIMSGKMNLGDLRNQAQSALDQLKELEQDFEDEDLSSLLGGYAAILENFLRQTTPKVSTNSSPAQPRKK
jgi:hypothetical protein